MIGMPGEPTIERLASMVARHLPPGGQLRIDGLDDEALASVTARIGHVRPDAQLTDGPPDVMIVGLSPRVEDVVDGLAVTLDGLAPGGVAVVVSLDEARDESSAGSWSKLLDGLDEVVLIEQADAPEPRVPAGVRRHLPRTSAAVERFANRLAPAGLDARLAVLLRR